MRYSTFTLLFFVLVTLNSCTETNSSEANNDESKVTNEDKIEDTINSNEPEIIKEFELASNGLENKVLQHYLDKYKSNSLRSVHNGMPLVMDTAVHKVYIDNTLRTNSDLSFFNGKYPEFIEAPENPARVDEDLIFSKVNCEGFNDIQASDFFKNKEKFNSQDLLLVVSKAFFHNGAYYVHVWQFSNDKVIHQRGGTYKFDGAGNIVNQSYKNYYQLGYDRIDAFLDQINQD